MNLAHMKDAYRVPAAWRDLGLPGGPHKICRSPWPMEHKHGDVNPSFSVFDEGRRWRDFATGEAGSVLDFVAKARGCNVADAVRWIEERLGITRPDREPSAKGASRIPALRRGTEAEHRELIERRGFSLEGLRMAEQHGLLFFCELWGISAWAVSDQRRQLVEFRRLDGAKWPSYGRLPERKSHCIGSGKRWPIGTSESLPFPSIAMVEGAPDLLAACCMVVSEGKTATVAPVAVLGASNHHLDPEALSHFKGKSICLFPHVDDAGRKAARMWAKALKDAGAKKVTAFDLSSLVLVDGTLGKDLADVCRIDAACWEREPKFREVLP